LFITYQIPSDLISFGGDSSASKAEKLTKVKGAVQAMQTMIQNERQKELAEVRLEATMHTLEGLADKSVGGYRTTGGHISSLSNVEYPKSGGSLASGSVNVPQPGNNKGDKKLSLSHLADDYTQLPVEMDRKFEALDVDGALRPTIVDVGKTWRKKTFKALLANPEEYSLNIDEQARERNKAFDLLDALSRSGCLSFEQASLHIVLASTHCFDKTLMNTVIQDNVNPIEKVERSTLIVATTIHDRSAGELVAPEQLKRVATYSPLLFGEELPQIMGQ